jgi:hypothetical protein
VKLEETIVDDAPIGVSDGRGGSGVVGRGQHGLNFLATNSLQ